MTRTIGFKRVDLSIHVTLAEKNNRAVRTRANAREQAAFANFKKSVTSR